MIDAYNVARETGMGGRINTIMQTCFFAISGVLPREEAIDAIKRSIKKTYGKRGEAVVQQNFRAVDETLAHLHEVDVPAKTSNASALRRRPPVPEQAPEFVQDVLGPMIAGEGDLLPVSALPIDGTYPSGTAQWEKRNIALEIPVWDRTSASSAASACSSARTPSSAPRSTSRPRWPARPTRSSAPTRASKSSPA